MYNSPFSPLPQPTRLPRFRFSASLFFGVLIAFLVAPGCSSESVSHEWPTPRQQADVDRSSEDATRQEDTRQPDLGRTIDTAPDASLEDMTASPPCGTVADCGPNRQCLADICRDSCSGTTCPPTRTGPVCHQGLCVECTSNSDCTGGNRVCDTERFVCVDGPAGTTDAVIGAMYHQWWTPGRWQRDRENYVYRPVLGHYSNADRDVISTHHDWAQRAGINTCLFFRSKNGPNSSHRGISSSP